MSTHEYNFSGVPLKFPVKAYPSQVAMMSKIITSIQKCQNSLLESPTGSGKSLALLCGALAWQRAEGKKVHEFNELLEKATVNQDPDLRDALIASAGADGVEYDEEDQFTLGPTSAQLDAAAVALAKEASLGEDPGGGFFPDGDDDFQQPAAKRPKSAKPDAASSLYHLPPDQAKQIPGSDDQFLKMPKKKKVPQIFFGTRTHKQVAQIVRELKKTAYSGVRMTILGSRDHTCIHPSVSKSFNKNQDCTELLDKKKGMGCRFQSNVKQKLASHHSLRVYLGHQEAWDLEDIVKVGRTVKACPYFATRELKTSAQIIFCPYNYLTDWKIRKAMQISLKNQIVVLDEAHNIEDTAREASSGKWGLEEVTHAIQELEKLASAGVEAQTHTALAGFCSRLAMWMDRCSKLNPDYTDFTSSSKVWNGTGGLAELNTHVFDVESYEDIKGMVDQALKERAIAMENNDGDGGGEEEQGPAVVLARGTADLLDSFMCVLGFMMDNDHRHRDDFKVAVTKAQVRKKGGGKGWFGKGDQSTTLENKVTLALWCLNPAVCFSALKEDCRSIILTSGTLSPMVSFASELNVKFSVQLEANHVIDRKQVWVGTMSHGPTGHNLNATYKNTSSYTWQDELGKLIAGVCATIKHGVLVFLPSYKMLNDLTLRWQSTELWNTISTRKSIVIEPKFANDFDVAMKMFYSLIKDTDDGPLDNGQDGALFLAVCRGKVSEGMDFADNNARAVICVGIPFPHLKDPLVDLKKKYNDQRKTKEPNILSGGEWYEIQAFRALNQALGRCIRHKQDWGAILMVDDRFGKVERYVGGLSKWVRKMVVHHNQFSHMIETLKEFSADMEQMEKDNRAAEEELRIKREMEEKDKREMEEQKEKIDLNVQDCQATENGYEISPKSAWSPGTSEGASVTLASKVAMLKAMRSPPLSNPLSKKASNSKNLDSTTHLGVGSHMDSATHLGNNSNRYVPKSFGGSGKFKEPIDQSEQDKSNRKMRDKLKEFHRNPESKLKSPPTLMGKDLVENGVENTMREPDNGFDGYNDFKEEATTESFKFMTGKRNKKTGEKITKEMQDAKRDKEQLVHLYNSAENEGVKREMSANDGEVALQKTANEDSKYVVAETNFDKSKEKIRNKLKMFQRSEDSTVEDNMPRDSSSLQNQKESPKEARNSFKWNGNQIPSSDIKVLNIAHPCPEKENINGNVNEIHRPLKYDNDFISANVALVNAQSSDSTLKLCDKDSVLSSSKGTVGKGSEKTAKTAFTFSKFEKEKSSDRDLENLLRFRRESGGKVNDLNPKINELEGNLSNDELWADSDDEFLKQFDLNESVPDSKLEVKVNNEKLFDSDEDFCFPEDNEIESKTPSPILSKKKPTTSSRKPLFAKSTNIVASSSNLANVGATLIPMKPVLIKANGLKRKAVGGPASKMQWVSSDEELEPPRQIKPSLTFEDDIEEDVVIERKVKQRRLSRKSLPKRQRTSLERNTVVTNEATHLSHGGDMHVKSERPSIPVATNQSFKVSSEGFTEVYTDGACTNNGRGNAKAGVGVWWGVNHPMNLSQPVGGDKQTNNTAEIQAACQAIRQAGDAGILKLLVHTDSQFVINCVTLWMANWKRNGWKTAAGQPVKNKDDLEDLDAAINSGNIQVKWNHVRGHSGNAGNEGADKLAVQGAKMQTLKNVSSGLQTKKSVPSSNWTQKSAPSAPQSKKSAQITPQTERTFVLDSDDDFV